MFLPKSDLDCDYDHQDVVMSWPRILGAAALSLALLVLVTPAVWLVALFERAPAVVGEDPIRAALAKAGEG